MVLLAILLALLVSACGGAASPASPGATPSTTTVATTAPTGTPSPASPTPAASTAPASSTPTSTAAPSITASPASPSTAPPSATPAGTPVPVVAPDITALRDPAEGVIPPYERTSPTTGTITTGPATIVATATIGTGGGTIEAPGIRIGVPAGALAADTTFTVSSATITAADFSGLITPVTPMYEIEPGGVEFAFPVTVQLSASVPAGTTALVFTYDPGTGTPTPLIPGETTVTSIEAGTMHFSPVFGATVDGSAIPPIADSGFRPGVDDWQFLNAASYAAPRGHFEGQVLSELGYYVMQRLGEGASPLHGLYDNNGADPKTPMLWEDDSDGYRLASAVQITPGSVVPIFGFVQNLSTFSFDPLTYAALRVGIAVTGLPQLLLLTTENGESWHAILVYRVTPQWVLVADPNFPGIGRQIRYYSDTGRFEPFESADSAIDLMDGNTVVYTRFAYVAWTPLMMAVLSAMWADAGAAADSVFPSYQLQMTTEQDAAGNDLWVPLVDGFVVPGSMDSVKLMLPRLSDGATSTMRVYQGASTEALGDWGWEQTVRVEPGENAFGFEIWGWTELGWRYVDFVRLTITREEAPSPSPKNDRLTLQIEAVVPTDTVGKSSCAATVYLVFSRLGGPPDSFQGRAGLSAICSNRPFTAIDTNGGTFDGKTFTLPDGRFTYTGTFDGTTATITGGPPGTPTMQFSVP